MKARSGVQLDGLLTPENDAETRSCQIARALRPRLSPSSMDSLSAEDAGRDPETTMSEQVADIYRTLKYKKIGVWSMNFIERRAKNQGLHEGLRCVSFRFLQVLRCHPVRL